MVEAQGVRGFRKSLDQSCRLDPLIVSHHNSLDAACCSGKRNPGKAVSALPCFSCSSWAPPAKPSPSGSAFTCAHRARRRTAIPHRSPAEGGTPAGELRLGTFPGAMPQCEQGRRQADLFLPLAAALCAPLPATAGEVLRRAGPDLPWQRLAAGVFRSRSQRACAEQSVPHFYTCREKEKKADILETQIFLYLSWCWQ